MEELKKKATAEITIQIDVYCPYCDEMINLLDNDAHGLTDDGYIYRQAFSNSGWGCDNFNETVTCPDCKKDFIVENITH